MKHLAIGTILAANVLFAFPMANTAVADSRDRRQDASLASRPYVDPKGFFSITPPCGWRKQEYPKDPRGKVAFLKPNASLRILAKATDVRNLNDLVENMKQKERDFDIPMHIQRTVFNGMPAIKRIATINMRGVTSKILWIDLLIDGTYHNIQYSSDPSSFEKYHDTAWKSILTYEPKTRTGVPSSEDIRKHEIAKWVRLATIFMEANNYDAAQEAVSVGLSVNPTNAELQALEEKLEDHRHASSPDSPHVALERALPVKAGGAPEHQKLAKLTKKIESRPKSLGDQETHTDKKRLESLIFGTKPEAVAALLGEGCQPKVDEAYKPTGVRKVMHCKNLQTDFLHDRLYQIHYKAGFDLSVPLAPFGESKYNLPPEVQCKMRWGMKVQKFLKTLDQWVQILGRSGMILVDRSDEYAEEDIQRPLNADEFSMTMLHPSRHEYWVHFGPVGRYSALPRVLWSFSFDPRSGRLAEIAARDRNKEAILLIDSKDADN